MSGEISGRTSRKDGKHERFELVVRQLLESFATNGASTLAQLVDAAGADNVADVTRFAHTLKSNAASFGASPSG